MKRIEKKEKLAELKKSVSPAKNDLIRLIRDVEEVSKVEARRLEKIVIRLEAWQNT